MAGNTPNKINVTSRESEYVYKKLITLKVNWKRKIYKNFQSNLKV